VWTLGRVNKEIEDDLTSRDRWKVAGANTGFALRAEHAHAELSTNGKCQLLRWDSQQKPPASLSFLYPTTSRHARSLNALLGYVTAPSLGTESEARDNSGTFSHLVYWLRLVCLCQTMGGGT
jgi:hypothetical protein